MDLNKIEVGDFVRITFVCNGPNLYGTVLNVPSAIGDSWIIESEGATEDTREITYVQLFQTITLFVVAGVRHKGRIE